MALVKRLCCSYNYLIFILSGVYYLRLKVIFFYRIFNLRDLDLLSHFELDHCTSGKINSIIEASYYTERKADQEYHYRNAITDLSLVHKPDGILYME